MMSKRVLAAAAASLLVLTGCSVTVNEAGGSGSGSGDGESGDGESGNTGTVSVAGANTGVEADAIQGVIDEFVNPDADYVATYSGSDGFEQEVVIQIEGGTPPDIGFYPQPGAVLEQAAQGNAVALEDLGLDIGELEAKYGEYLISLGEYEGKHYGVPTDVNYKSAVWYNVPAFEAANYETPATWEDLIALADQMVADGTAPFCIGTGSDAATGWPATDWMEDIVLRDGGTEVYDQWVANEIAFDSPEIRSALDRFSTIVFSDGYVFGGPGNITSTDFRDAPDPMFNDPPNCYMHRQATFITNFFPEGLEAGTDYNFFAFPSIEGNDGSLMGGGMAAVFDNRPEVSEFLNAYTSEDAQCAIGSFEGVALISPNVNTSSDCYQNELIAQASELLLGALSDGTARFDGSDLMPPSVGSGSFWVGMNTFTDAGPDNVDQVLTDIDSGWG